MTGLGERRSRDGGARRERFRAGAGTEDGGAIVVLELDWESNGRDGIGLGVAHTAWGSGRDELCGWRSSGGGRVVLSRRVALGAICRERISMGETPGEPTGGVAAPFNRSSTSGALARLRKSLIPARSLTLSPTLCTPISLRNVMSRSSRTLPSISFLWNRLA